MNAKNIIPIVVFCFAMCNTVSAVNYCADPNNKGCALMEDSGNETDRGLGDDYTETSGIIPQDADRMFGDYSRDFEAGDSEWLEQADGLSTDISGANQELSIVFWIKSELSTNAFSGVINKYDGIGLNRQYIVYLATTGKVTVLLSSNGTDTVTTIGASDVTDTTWRHIGVVYNDIDIRIYVDGVLDSNGVDNPKAYTGGLHDGDDDFTIGTYLTYYFAGKIDDVGIFDRALTSGEVLDIKNNGLFEESSTGLDSIFFGMEF